MHVLERELGAEFAQRLRAFGHDLRGNLIGACGSGRSGALRVAEDVQAHEARLLDDPAGLGKVLVRLAREPDDDVGRERDRGHLSPELCDEVEKFISGVIARHLVEHLRGTRLQAQVEMPADAAIRGGKRRDQRRFQALRLD